MALPTLEWTTWHRTTDVTLWNFTTHRFWSLVSPRPWSLAYPRPSSFRANPVHVHRQFINDVSFKKVIDSWFLGVCVSVYVCVGCVLPSEKRSHSCEMLGGQDGRVNERARVSERRWRDDSATKTPWSARAGRGARGFPSGGNVCRSGVPKRFTFPANPPKVLLLHPSTGRMGRPHHFPTRPLISETVWNGFWDSPPNDNNVTVGGRANRGRRPPPQLKTTADHIFFLFRRPQWSSVRYRVLVSHPHERTDGRGPLLIKSRHFYFVILISEYHVRDYKRQNFTRPD